MREELMLAIMHANDESELVANLASVASMHELVTLKSKATSRDMQLVAELAIQSQVLRGEFRIV